MARRRRRQDPDPQDRIERTRRALQERSERSQEPEDGPDPSQGPDDRVSRTRAALEARTAESTAVLDRLTDTSRADRPAVDASPQVDRPDLSTRRSSETPPDRPALDPAVADLWTGRVMRSSSQQPDPDTIPDRAPAVAAESTNVPMDPGSIARREASEEARRRRNEEWFRELPADMTAGQRFAAAADNFARTYMEMQGGTLEGIGLTAKDIDEVLGLRRDMPVGDYTTFKIGQKINETAEQLFPRDPELQGRFLEDVMPSAFASVYGFITSVAAPRAIRGMVNYVLRRKGPRATAEALARTATQARSRAAQRMSTIGRVDDVAKRDLAEAAEAVTGLRNLARGESLTGLATAGTVGGMVERAAIFEDALYSLQGPGAEAARARYEEVVEGLTPGADGAREAYGAIADRLNLEAVEAGRALDAAEQRFRAAGGESSQAAVDGYNAEVERYNQVLERLSAEEDAAREAYSVAIDELVAGADRAEEVYQAALEGLGPEHEDAARAISRWGLGIGMLEAIPAEAQVARLIGIRPGMRPTRVAQMISGAGEEGLQEGFQSFFENLVASGNYDPDRPVFEGVGEGAFIGTITGGSVAGLHSAVGDAIRRDPAQAEEAAPAHVELRHLQNVSPAGALARSLRPGARPSFRPVAEILTADEGGGTPAEVLAAVRGDAPTPPPIEGPGPESPLSRWSRLGHEATPEAAEQLGNNVPIQEHAAEFIFNLAGVADVLQEGIETGAVPEEQLEQAARSLERWWNRLDEALTEYELVFGPGTRAELSEAIALELVGAPTEEEVAEAEAPAAEEGALPADQVKARLAQFFETNAPRDPYYEEDPHPATLTAYIHDLNTQLERVAARPWGNQLAVQEHRGGKATERADRELADLVDAGLVQVGYDFKGTPHFGLAGTPPPPYLAVGLEGLSREEILERVKGLPTEEEVKAGTWQPTETPPPAAATPPSIEDVPGAEIPPAFTPSTEWQPVPEGAVLPNGLEIRMDQESGQTFARVPPTAQEATDAPEEAGPATAAPPSETEGVLTDGAPEGGTMPARPPIPRQAQFPFFLEQMASRIEKAGDRGATLPGNPEIGEEGRRQLEEAGLLTGDRMNAEQFARLQELPPAARAAEYFVPADQDITSGEVTTGRFGGGHSTVIPNTPAHNNVMGWIGPDGEFLSLEEGENLAQRLYDDAASIGLSRVPTPWLEGVQATETAETTEGTRPGQVQDDAAGQPAVPPAEEGSRRLEDAIDPERAALLRELYTDELTGLSSQRAWLQGRERIDADPELTVVAMDVRGLKAVNDLQNHEAGDRLLVRAADAIRQAYEQVTGGPADERVLFRLGGDEFVAAVPTGTEAAFQEALQEAFPERPIGGSEFSTGIRSGAGPTYAEADQAMVDRADREEGPRYRSLASPAIEGPPGTEQPKDAWDMLVDDIAVDQDRFQFKLDAIYEGGVTDALRGVNEWNRDLAGIILVWREGDTVYVVNGHHRLQLAKQLGVERVLVRFIEAPNAVEARSIGAMANIAENNGTALDAAKVIRDGGLTPAQFEERGIPLNGAMARDGFAISKLHEAIFLQVVQGDVPMQRAAIIGASGLSHEDQWQLFTLLKAKEKAGDRLRNEEIIELVRFAESAPTTQETNEDLFGTETIDRGLVIEKAKVSARIRTRFMRDRRLFAYLTKSGRADRLKQKGVAEVDIEKAAAIASDAAQLGEFYDRLATRAGPIADAINEGAQALADGESLNAIEERIYGAIKTALTEALPGGAGSSAVESEVESYGRSPTDERVWEAELNRSESWQESIPRRFWDVQQEGEGLEVQDDLFGGPAKLSGQQQREIFRTGEVAPGTSLEDTKARARASVERLRPFVDGRVATDEQLAAYQEALAFLNQANGMSAEEVRIRLQRAGIEPDPSAEGTIDMFGVEQETEDVTDRIERIQRELEQRREWAEGVIPAGITSDPHVVPIALIGRSVWSLRRDKQFVYVVSREPGPRGQLRVTLFDETGPISHHNEPDRDGVIDYLVQTADLTRERGEELLEEWVQLPSFQTGLRNDDEALRNGPATTVEQESPSIAGQRSGTPQGVDFWDVMVGKMRPWYYSRLEETVAGAPMEKATAEQWVGWLAKQPVSQKEIDWVGVADILHGLDVEFDADGNVVESKPRSIEKAELLQGIRENQIQLYAWIATDSDHHTRALNTPGLQAHRRLNEIIDRLGDDDFNSTTWHPTLVDKAMYATDPLHYIIWGKTPVAGELRRVPTQTSRFTVDTSFWLAAREHFSDRWGQLPETFRRDVESKARAEDRPDRVAEFTEIFQARMQQRAETPDIYVDGVYQGPDEEGIWNAVYDLAFAWAEAQELNALKEEARTLLENIRRWQTRGRYQAGRATYGEWIADSSGSDYREHGIRAPGLGRPQSYQAPHDGLLERQDLVAHFRQTQRRLIDGPNNDEKLLFMVEEAQSDWSIGYRKHKAQLDTDFIEARMLELAQEAARTVEDYQLSDHAGELEPGVGDLDFADLSTRLNQRDAIYYPGVLLTSEFGHASEAWLADPPVKLAAAGTRARELAIVERRLQNIQLEWNELDDILRKAESGYGPNPVPESPYLATEDWLGLVARRAIDVAVREGFDGLGFPTEEWAERVFRLREHVTHVVWNPWSQVWSSPLVGSGVQYRDVKGPQELRDQVGGDIADQLLERTGQANENLDVKLLSLDEAIEFAGDGPSSRFLHSAKAHLDRSALGKQHLGYKKLWVLGDHSLTNDPTALVLSAGHTAQPAPVYELKGDTVPHDGGMHAALRNYGMHVVDPAVRMATPTPQFIERARGVSVVTGSDLTIGGAWQPKLYGEITPKVLRRELKNILGKQAPKVERRYVQDSAWSQFLNDAERGNRNFIVYRGDSFEMVRSDAIVDSFHETVDQAKARAQELHREGFHGATWEPAHAHKAAIWYVPFTDELRASVLEGQMRVLQETPELDLTDPVKWLQDADAVFPANPYDGDQELTEEVIAEQEQLEFDLAYGGQQNVQRLSMRMIEILGSKASMYADGVYSVEARREIVAEAKRISVHVDMRGQQLDLNKPQEIIDLLRWTRDPEAETFHVIGVDPNGAIVSQMAISSGAVSTVRLPTALMRYEIRRAVKKGATQIVFSHNHPEGTPTHSPADKSSMRFWEKDVREMYPDGSVKVVASIVVNHDTANVYVPKIGQAPPEATGILEFGSDKWGVEFEYSVKPRGPDWTHMSRGNKLGTVGDLARALIRLHGDNAFTIAWLDTKKKVLTVSNHAPESVASMHEWVPRLLKEQGAHSLAIYVGPTADPNVYEQIIGQVNTHLMHQGRFGGNAQGQSVFYPNTGILDVYRATDGNGGYESALVADKLIPSVPDSARPGAVQFVAQDTPDVGANPDSERTLDNEVTAKDLKVAKWIVEFFEEIGLPMSLDEFGVLSRRTLGAYWAWPEYVLLRHPDEIETAAHEVGHHIHKLFFGTVRRGLSGKVLAPWSKELIGVAKAEGFSKSRQTRKEGLAEFFALYVVDPERARELAPGWYSYADGRLAEQYPIVRDALLELRRRHELFKTAPDEALSDARIAEKRNPWHVVRDKMRTGWARKRLEVLDHWFYIEQLGKEFDPDGMLEILARTSMGAAGAGETMLSIGMLDWNTVEIVGPSLDEIMAPVSTNRREYVQFRRWAVAIRAVELAEQGIETGFDIAVQRRIIKKYESPEYRETWEKIQEFNRGMLQYLVDAGVISQELMDKLREKHPNYLPFFRSGFDEKEALRVGGQQFAHLFSPIKKIKGSRREIIDPFESLARMAYTYASVAARQELNTYLIKIGRNVEGAGSWLRKIPPPTEVTRVTKGEITSWIIGQVEQKEMFDGPVGDDPIFGEGVIDALQEIMPVFRPGTWFGQENVISRLDPETGKREWFWINDELWESMQGLDRQQMGMLFKFAQHPARWLRAGATGTPEFLIRNLVRDQNWSAVISDNIHIPWEHATRGLIERWRQHTGRPSIVPQMKATGGEFANLVDMDREWIRDTKAAILRDGIPYVVKHPIYLFQMISRGGENVPRTGEYSAAVERLREQGYEGRELYQRASVASRGGAAPDYLRRGSNKTVQAIRMIATFWNANLQSWDQLYRGLTDTRIVPGTKMKKWQLTTLKAVAWVTTIELFLMALYHDDPDFQEQPQWQKDLFWLVKIPRAWTSLAPDFMTAQTGGTGAGRAAADRALLRRVQPFAEASGDHVWLRIPKPFQLGMIFGTIPHRMIDWAMDRDPQGVQEAIESFIGIDPTLEEKGLQGRVHDFWTSEVGQVVIPDVQVVSPWIEGFVNYSRFLERPMVGRSEQQLEPEFQHGDYESNVSIMLGRYLNWSPRKIDNVIQGYTGGVGQYVLDGIDFAGDAIGAVPSPDLPSRGWPSWPFARAFFAPPAGFTSESTERFYEEWGMAQRAYQTWMTNRRNNHPFTDQHYERNVERIRSYQFLEGQRSRMNDLRERADAIRYDLALDPRTRQQLMDELGREYAAIARNALERDFSDDAGPADIVPPGPPF